MVIQQKLTPSGLLFSKGRANVRWWRQFLKQHSENYIEVFIASAKMVQEHINFTGEAKRTRIHQNFQESFLKILQE